MPVPANAAYIFDIDDTLADPTHRAHMLNGNPTDADWATFFKESINDAPIEATVLIARALQNDYKIILLTGRNEIARDATAEWCKRHGIQYDELIMRPLGDRRSNKEFKAAAYEEQIKPKYSVLAAFDNDAVISEMWKKIGIHNFIYI